MSYDPLEERFHPAQPASEEDNRITAAINDLLVADEQTRHQLVEVVTIDGRVVLTGKINSKAARSAVERLARSVPGVTSVVNQLTLSGFSTEERGDEGAVNANGDGH